MNLTSKVMAQVFLCFAVLVFVAFRRFSEIYRLGFVSRRKKASEFERSAANFCMQSA